MKSINEAIDLNALKLQPTLNSKFWSVHGVLDEKVKEAIKRVAKDFYESLQINIPLLDVIFTGSLANYNWSKYSDVDIHLVIDFNKLYDTIDPNNYYDKEDLLKEYFTDKKELWNKSHKMTIFGHEVEVYVQDDNEQLDATGIYSITKDKWLNTPSHVNFKPNFKLIRTKANQIMQTIDNLAKKEDVKSLEELKDKLKKMRQRGLDTDGELSNLNLIYKILRREGYIEKLYDLKNKIFDKKNTIK